MKIYIAGPYTKGDVAQNVKRAISDGDYVARLGHVPFIPHLTHFWHMHHPHEYQFWIEQDLEWLKACDAILRLPGESAGADHEVEVAQQMGMTVYYSVFDIPRQTPNLNPGATW
ncbi:MAG: DUF1937 family protein [Chloroflexi bacterium]|nr:DUF1937 family protein [Chloroflexota bacterium]